MDQRCDFVFWAENLGKFESRRGSISFSSTSVLIGRFHFIRILTLLPNTVLAWVQCFREEGYLWLL